MKLSACCFVQQIKNGLRVSWRGYGQKSPSHAQHFSNKDGLEAILFAFGMELTPEQIDSIWCRIFFNIQLQGDNWDEYKSKPEELREGLFVDSGAARQHRDKAWQ